MSEARIIPLHADDSGDRTRWRPRQRRAPAEPASAAAAHRRRRPSSRLAARVGGERYRGRAAVPAPAAGRRLRGRRVRLRPATSTTTWSCLRSARCTRSGSASRRSACTTCPTSAARSWWPTTPALCRWTRLMTTVARARRPPRPAAPADARCGPGCSSSPVVGPLARKARRHAGLQPGRRAAAVRRRARRGVAGGLQGHRQAVPRPVQAAALRPRRIRVGRAAHRGADHPVLDRRRGGDLSEDRRHQTARPPARRAVLPGHPDVPAARARSG